MCTIRRAQPDDLPGAARVYLAAFPETRRDLGAGDLAPEAVADLFSICLRADADGFLVAEAAGRVVGYVVCPADVGAIWRTALRDYWPLRLLWRWATGRYRLPAGAAVRAAADAVAMSLARTPPAARCRARILSLAVHPQLQGQGIGRKLMAAALQSLRARGTLRVRLEVRPDNRRARRLYESLGFRPVCTVRDTRGPWLVMVLDLSARWPQLRGEGPDAPHATSRRADAP